MYIDIEDFVKYKEHFFPSGDYTDLNLACYQQRDIKTLIQILEQNRSIRGISIAGISLAREEMQSLARVLEKCSNLKSLIFRRVIDNGDFLDLFKVLEKNTALFDLSLEGDIYYANKDRNLQYLIHYLKNNPSLTALEISHDFLDFSEAFGNSRRLKSFFEVLKTHKNLTTLNLSYNYMNLNASFILADFLRANSSLTTLTLDGTSIPLKGLASITQSLEHHPSLTILNLNNGFPDEGAEVLAKLLDKNLTLTDLSLKHSNINNKGAYALIEVLKRNKTLMTLNLKYHIWGYYRATNLDQTMVHQLSDFLEARKQVRDKKMKESVEGVLPIDLAGMVEEYLDIKKTPLLSSQPEPPLPFVPVSRWVKFSYWLRNIWNRVRDFIKDKLSPKKSNQDYNKNKVVPAQIAPIIQPKVEVKKIESASADSPPSLKMPKKR